MAIMAMDTVHKNKLNGFVLAIIFSNYAAAGDWKFEPSLLIDETYTNNVNLSADNKISSLVSQTGLNLETAYQAQQAVFNFSSQSRYALYSHDHELDNDYHTIASNFRLQLWPNGVVIFASANIDNQARNGNRNALADIVSSDTIQVETYNGGVEYNIDNSRFIINSAIGFRQTNSEDDIGNREGVVAEISSQNGSGARNIFWDFEHNYQELKNNAQDGKMHQTELKVGLISEFKLNPFIRYYDEDNSGNLSNPNNSTESNSYGVGIRWLISPRLYLDTAYNKPIGNNTDIDGDEQKEYVNAAIKWQPSIRTSLEASYSERFFGDSYGLNFVHKNKRLTNSISYIEDVQTLTRNNFIAETIGFYLCPNNNVVSISECTLQEGTTIIPGNPSDSDNQGYSIFPIQEFILVEDNVLSLNKTLNWNSTLELPRTTITFNGNRQRRDNLDTRIKDESLFFGLNVNRSISGRSSVNLDMSYTENNFQLDTEQEQLSRYRRYKIGYEKSLNSSLSFNIDLSYLNRSSSDFTLNYEEGRLSAKITKGF